MCVIFEIVQGRPKVKFGSNQEKQGTPSMQRQRAANSRV